MELRPRNRHTLLILVAMISGALLIPTLFMDGMFMDGLIYACVGKNLSLDIGTFWDPQFSSTYMVSYHEQPPLLFGIEAVFFNIMGTSLYTERVYCLFMAIICFFVQHYTWKTFFTNKITQRKLVWVPLLFFFASPVTFWAYNNNVEEATMVVFALASAGFQLKAIQAAGNGFLWFALGGLAIVASSMCKGFQGMFPVIIPLTWFIVVRTISFRKAIIGNLIVFAIPAIFYLLLAQYEPAVHSYSHYYHDRLAATFNIATTATTSSRFFILFELLLDTLPALFLGALLSLAARKITFTFKKEALFFLIVGMSGIIPLMVTLEQRGFYLVTGLPFVAISLALLVLDGANWLQEKVDQSPKLNRALLSIAVLLFAGITIVTLLLAGQPKRDIDLLHDVNLIGARCGENTIASANERTWTNWSLQGYLVRYNHISLAKGDTTARYYILTNEEPAPSGYYPLNLGTRQFHLYERRLKP